MIDAARVSFTEPDVSELPGHLRLSALTSLEWWKRRQSSERFQLDDFPTFDQAWLLYLLTRAEPPSPALEAVSHYAEDVRQGRWVDRVSPEQAAQALYLAVAQAHLPAEPVRYFEELEAFFDVIARSPAALTTTPLFAKEPRFQRYIAGLVDDRRLYKEDLQRAQTWRLTLGDRPLKVLVLDKPRSTQFKLWARRFDDCALLLVKQADGLLVLSADPSSKLKVDWAAPLLSKLDVHPWYAGERHQGTLIASSREGTRLGFADVRRALGARLPTPKGLLAVPVMVVLIAAVIAALKPAAAAKEPAGAKGEPLPREKVLSLLQAPDGPASFERYALLAGVCSYGGDRELKAPCGDARALREVLIGRFGYRPENVMLFVDDGGEGAQRPDAPSLKLAVERFRQTFPKADGNSSFLFYYSGHGGYEKGARKDFGLLQPAGYFEQPDVPMATRGWDMQELLDDLRKGVPSRHVMLVLDACYSGWAVGAKGDAMLSPEVRSLWAERAEVVLTAGTKGQRAWEDDAEAPRWAGHSAFTAYLLEGLEKGDSNDDGVITDEELAGYLRVKVPQAVKAEKRAEQTPQFFRFDEALPKSGQFLFVRPR
ncbi:MAG: caspase family protein [Myxococcaceae bacterium]|nr:caspase family protein [Myxococcaceae bacterium]